jgi:hypothetical protein
LEFFIVAFQSGGGFTFIARRNASRGGKEHCKGGSFFVLLIPLILTDVFYL